MLIRYAFLLTLAAGALYGLINLSATTGQVMLVDAGAVPAMGHNTTLWVLAAIAGLTALSLCRFVVFGLPAMVGTWYESNKNWLAMAVLGGVASGVFYLM